MVAAGDSTLQVRTAAEQPLSIPDRCVWQMCCSRFDPVTLLPARARPWSELYVKPKPELELSSHNLPQKIMQAC